MSDTKKPTGLLPLQQWMNANKPAEEMRYHGAALDQMCWVRDRLYFMLLKSLTPGGPRPVSSSKNEIMSVHGTHYSKSIHLPVYRFDYLGVTIKLRGNFHDWCVKIWGIEGLDLPNFITREFLDGYYEGMEDNTDGDVSPSLRFAVGSGEKLYAVLFHIANVHRERKELSDG